MALLGGRWVLRHRSNFGTFLGQDGCGDGMCVCAACGVHCVPMKDGCALTQMKDGTIFGTKEAHVRATTLCVRQSFDPFLSLGPSLSILKLLFLASCSAFAIAAGRKYILS